MNPEKMIHYSTDPSPHQLKGGIEQNSSEDLAFGEFSSCFSAFWSSRDVAFRSSQLANLLAYFLVEILFNSP